MIYALFETNIYYVYIWAGVKQTFILFHRLVSYLSVKWFSSIELYMFSVIDLLVLFSLLLLFCWVLNKRLRRLRSGHTFVMVMGTRKHYLKASNLTKLQCLQVHRRVGFAFQERSPPHQVDPVYFYVL